MPNCAVLWCKNYPGKRHLSNQITFHRFPGNTEDSERRKQWIDLIRTVRKNPQWQPAKSSVICCNHFDEADIFTSKTGLRHLARHSIPKEALTVSPLGTTVSIKETLLEEQEDTALSKENAEFLTDNAKSIINESLLEEHKDTAPPNDNNHDESKTLILIMEKNSNQASNRYSGMCRACLAIDNTKPMTDELSHMFKDITGLQLSCDNLPKVMCEECTQNLRVSSEFRNLCLQSNQWLIEKINKKKSEMLETKINKSKSVNNKEQIIPKTNSKTKKNIKKISGKKYSNAHESHGNNSDCIDVQIKKDPFLETNVFDETNSQNIGSDIQFYCQKFNTAAPEIIEINPDIIKPEILETYKMDQHVDTVFNDFEHEEFIETEIINNEIVKTESEHEDMIVTEIINDEITNTELINDNESCNNDIKTKGIKKRTKKCRNLNKPKKIYSRKKPKEYNKMIAKSLAILEELKKNFNIRDLNAQEQVEEFEKRKLSDNFKNAKFKCDLCYKGFTNEQAFKNHSFLHTETGGSVMCDICKIYFRNDNLMKNHRYKNHKMVMTCKNCDFTTSHRNTADLHTARHNGVKYTCRFCQREFSRETSLLCHTRLKHATHYCAFCGYAFLTETGLNVHIRYKHARQGLPPEDGPKCDLCNITFANDEALTTHVNISAVHGGTKSNQFTYKRGNSEKSRKCDQCDAVLPSYWYLRRHFEEHHPTSTMKEESYLCFVCGKSFMFFGTYKSHLDGHDFGEKFRCDLCDSTFNKRSSFYLHKVRHVKKFSCEICHKNFHNKTNVIRHHKVIHWGVRNEMCDFCEKRFKTKAEKKLHTDHVHFNKPYKPRIRSKKREKKDSLSDNHS